LFRSQLVVVHSVPCQPRPYCRISNWQGSVSGQRNNFATAYPLEIADLSASAAFPTRANEIPLDVDIVVQTASNQGA
jgi:hypothetical protein